MSYVTEAATGSIVVLQTGIFNDAQVVGSALRRLPSVQCTSIDISKSKIIGFNDDSWDDVMDRLLSSSKIITV